ncbi:hypothetical protein BB559_001858 [Furculomyces boomerangus]|uniref:AAA+ ATPase domain-containing protein n=2 Tax=Harpellales TaxID=61421 RepID=A0A2T9Z009_9FUNG|nr:hypothetical protein BB559_001858 [Furculomyces boomerangus]PWA03491.1 hypothetical protein BB558_000350 [Smittium angustum]
MGIQTRKIITDVALLVITQVAVYYGFKYLISVLDPTEKDNKETKNRGSNLISRLKLQKLSLNQHEKIIMSEVIVSEDINVTFKDIGGLDEIITDLKESIIYPLTHPHLFTSAMGLLGSAKGVLLYGPPGCGKTMLAKALARESGARFINLHLSTLMDKWFGESNRLVRAVFTLAEKLQPTIIFIDEIDSFLRTRQSGDHEATSMMKAEFMSLWDGLTTAEGNQIIVIGATNRPNDIDLAILRRMPKRFYLKPPNFDQRLSILELLLKNINVVEDFDFEELARRTANMSGSDIKELCRNAAMNPITEYMRKNPLTVSSSLPINETTNVVSIKTQLDEKNSEKFDLRPLNLEDFEVALHKVDESLLSSYNTSTIDHFLSIDEND